MGSGFVPHTQYVQQSGPPSQYAGLAADGQDVTHLKESALTQVQQVAQYPETVRPIVRHAQACVGVNRGGRQ